MRGLRNIEKLINEIPHKTYGMLIKVANDILRRSQPLVPVDTGKLKRSGKVESNYPNVSVIYSAKSEKGYDYSVIQHENLFFNHRIGQAKYLQSAINVDKIVKELQKEIIK